MKHLSEEYRRGIIMPVDDYSENLMRQQYFDNDSKFKKLLIDDNSNSFDKLYDVGIIGKINTEIGSLIDDFETEFIELAQLDSINKIISSINKKKIGQRFAGFYCTISITC